MGIAERKAREKEQRKNEIIDAAERVFFSKGRLNATMDDVAEEAELSKGTLYLYFKNKEEILLTIHFRGLEILEKFFRKAFDSEKTGLKKIRAIGKAYNRFFEEYPNHFNALLRFKSHEDEYNHEDPFVMECHNQGMKTLNIVGEAIQCGIEDGSIRPDLEPFKTATVLWGLSSGIIQLLAGQGEHILKEHNISKPQMMEYAFQMIYKALKNE